MLLAAQRSSRPVNDAATLLETVRRFGAERDAARDLAIRGIERVSDLLRLLAAEYGIPVRVYRDGQWQNVDVFDSLEAFHAWLASQRQAGDHSPAAIVTREVYGAEMSAADPVMPPAEDRMDIEDDLLSSLLRSV